MLRPSIIRARICGRCLEDSVVAIDTTYSKPNAENTVNAAEIVLMGNKNSP